MNLCHREVVLEILGQVLHLVEEQIFDFLGSVSGTQNNVDTTEKVSVLAENVERVRKDNCFLNVSCDLSNQNKEENEVCDKKDLNDSFLEENSFVNGSKYSGTWNTVGMAGIGRYVFPNGTIFEGELRDDKVHGHGSMLWLYGQSIDGVWANGKLKMKRYKFKDSLEFAEDGWKYCRFPDRRFYTCITAGLRPARETLKTNCHPTKIIPLLCFDVGNGIYNPDIHCIMSYDSKKIIEIPTEAKAHWIINNCRKGFNEPTGYISWLNENWSKKIDRNLDIPYCLPLSNDSPQKWWQRLSSFEQDTSIYRIKNDYTCKNCYLYRKREEEYVRVRDHEDTGERNHCN